MDPIEFSLFPKEYIDLAVWSLAIPLTFWIFAPLVIQICGGTKFAFDAIDKPERVREAALDYDLRKVADQLKQLGFEPAGRLNEATRFAHGKWAQAQTLVAWATPDRAIYALLYRLGQPDLPRIALVSYLVDYTEIVTVAPGEGLQWNRRKSVRVEMPQANVPELFAAHQLHIGEAMARYEVQVAGPTLTELSALRLLDEQDVVRTGETLSSVGLLLMGQYVLPAAAGVLFVVRAHRESLGIRTVGISMLFGGVAYLLFWLFRSRGLLQKQTRNDHLQAKARHVLATLKKPQQ